MENKPKFHKIHISFSIDVWPDLGLFLEKPELTRDPSAYDLLRWGEVFQEKISEGIKMGQGNELSKGIVSSGI